MQRKMTKADERRQELGRLFSEWHRIVNFVRPRVVSRLAELQRKEAEREQVYRSARQQGLHTAVSHLNRLVSEEATALSHLDRELSLLQRDVARQREAVRKFWQNIKD